jgi:hypothetical protein
VLAGLGPPKRDMSMVWPVMGLSNRLAEVKMEGEMRVRDILFHSNLVSIDRDDLGLGVHLNSSGGFGSISHNAEHTLVGSFADGDRLPNQPVPSHRSRWSHWGIRSITVLQSRVCFSICCCCSAAFRRDGRDTDTSSNKNAGILWLSAIVDVDECSMNVQDDSGFGLATYFAHNITIPDFRSVAIRCNCIFSLLDLVGDLGGEHLADGSVLIEDSHRLAIDLDDTSDSGWAMKLSVWPANNIEENGLNLNEIVNVVFSKTCITCSITCLTQVLAEHSDFLHRHIGEDCDPIILDA